MDFSTIEDKLKAHIYIKLQDFIKDVKLCFDNCIAYNGSWHILSETAYRLGDYFEEQLQA